MHRSKFLATFLAAIFFLAIGAAAQVSPDLYSGLQWRDVGPYHGGRVASVTGAIGQAGTFYAGMPQGGIWKTTSAGLVWYPVFDQITDVDSIGAIAVAPSNSNVIYAGSGDAVEHAANSGEGGDGMYKSTDAGKTWQHIGLEGAYKIPSIVVDPKNPDIVIVAALSGLRGTQRGVFRTDNGGATWTNTLSVDAVTGGRDLASPFDMPNVVFATTIADGAETGPGGRGGGGGGGRGAAAGGPTRTKLFRSLDEGKTWTEIANDPQTNGRSSVAVAMNTQGKRVFVIGGAGLFRSDDQGATWRHMAAGVSGNAYICGVWVDPSNPDIVYTMSTAAYKSTDGGESFIAFKGAPGGEDMHEVWIDPTDGTRMIYGNDQGASVTLDGGKAWGSYFNMPAAQVYHISTDTRYPYWVLGSQQDTGGIMTRTRGDIGDISEADMLQNPSSESGTLTADPVNPLILYGVGYGTAGGSGLLKIDMGTGQWENASPSYGADAAKYRSGGSTWRRPDPFDPHSIYTNMQCIMVSHDQAHSWKAISPDLTTPKGEPQVPCGAPAAAPAAAAGGGGAAAPARGGRGGGRGGGSIADFAVSTLQKGVFWTITANGQIYNNLDGVHWTNVGNIPDTGVSLEVIEAGHTDLNTAYISGQSPRGGVNEDGNVPFIWRTHDGGKTWTKIVNGLPSGQPSGSWVNVVREDPKQKGLLYCGTESSVYVSFDDGDHWQSLRQNLPTTSVRDMVFHTDDHMNDLVIGTFGRGFWVLDDVSPLREIAQKSQAIAAAPAYFFKPGDAIRARASYNWGQPINPELPHAPNPPFGALFYYHLSRPPQGEITLQISDAAGKPVRTISSVAPTLPASFPYPSYWVATPQDLALPTGVGTNRFNWDLRYDDPPAFNFDLENQMDVAPGGFITPGPHGPHVIPGVYTMKLTVDGQTYTQTVTVHNDPRNGDGAKVTADLREKNRLIMQVYNAAKDSYRGNSEVAAARAQLTAATRAQLPADAAAAATAFDAKLATFGGVTAGRGGRGGGGGGFGRGGGAPAGGVIAFNTLNGSFDSLVSTQQVGLDDAPTQAEIDTWEEDCTNYNATVAAWKNLLSQDLATFNALLTRSNQPPLQVAPTALTPAACRFVTTP